ncbi:MAG: hypothetical protein IPL35_11805 [Sphingobacteriales bacterium]|nr:hypothetical protein [Sphingobacteriales bacterium]
MSVAPAAFSKEKNNVLFLIVSGFIVASFWSCGSKKNSGDTVLVSQQAAVKDTLPAMALTRYLTALKEGNEAAARAVFYDEAMPFTLTAPVPITDYKVISEGSINATEALRFDFQPAPQAGDVQMDVQQYITPHNEKLMFSYWLRKKDDIWKLATWTLWNADLQDSFAGFRDTSRRDSSVVEDLALPVGDINFSPDTAKTSYSPVPYDTINASVAIFTANEKIADLSKTASIGSAITIYEAHFANMVALTADACKNRDNDDVVYWDYYADGGKN